MNNLALLSTEEQNAITTHKKACLRRYYATMDKGQALMIKGRLQGSRGQPNKMSKRFIKRVNNAKGYELI